MPDTYYTPEEVADALKVSRNTVWRWIREGLLNAQLLPTGGYRITKESYEDFLANGANHVKKRGRRAKAN